MRRLWQNKGRGVNPFGRIGVHSFVPVSPPQKLQENTPDGHESRQGQAREGLARGDDIEALNGDIGIDAAQVFQL